MRVRPGHRVGLAGAARHHAVDAAGRTSEKPALTQVEVAARRALPPRRRAQARCRSPAPHDFTVASRVSGLKPGERVPLPLRDHGRRDSPVGRFRTALPAELEPDAEASASSPARSTRPATTRPTPRSPRRTSTSSSASATTSTSSAYDDRPAQRHDRRRTTTARPDARRVPRKYRLYQTDKHLQDVHAAHFVIAIWDDHEVEDNYAGEQPGGDAEPTAASPFAAAPRRRLPARSSSTCRGRGSARAGPRLRRRHARPPRRPAGARPAPATAPTSRARRPGRPAVPASHDGRRRARCSARRAEGVVHAARSPARAPRWKLVGNPVMMMALEAVPRGSAVHLPTRGTATGRAARARRPHRQPTMIADVAFLTGDIHTFFAGNVTRQRPRTGATRAPRPGGGARDRVRRRRDHVAGDRRPRAVTDEAQRVAAAAPGRRRRARQQSRSSSTPTRPTRATGS